jgi:hypothetical protein
MKWPASDGGANTFLKTDGSNNLSWATPSISAQDLTSVNDIQADWYWSSSTATSDPAFWIDASLGSVSLQAA